MTSRTQPENATEQVHETIWLQPWCDGCDKGAYDAESSRQWCRDEVWGPCEECGRKPVSYTITRPEKST